LEKVDYVTTQGDWTYFETGYIILNSRPALPEYQTRKIKKTQTAEESSFTFFDISGDTLPILGATKNGQWFGSIHKLIKSFQLNLTKGDTVTADILGYQKFQLQITDSSQFEYLVTLSPAYNADKFKDKRLLLKRHNLIDKEFNEIYRKRSGM
jgi:hypothetical protein